jgi:hypothetical protein
MKTSDQLKPNFGPVYAAAMYPGLAAIFQKHGYALAVHGSLARDFDLVAIPWIENPSNHWSVLNEVTSEFAVTVTTGDPVVKNHGRVAYTLSIGFGECAVDLSFMPVKGTQ